MPTITYRVENITADRPRRVVRHGLTKKRLAPCWLPRRDVACDRYGRTVATRKGFYREVDDSPVSQAEAIKTWAPIAIDELRATACVYDSVVTYKELALRVQEVSGVRTTQLIMHWIGRLLDEVQRIAEDRGEPPLSALCVRADGTVGDGYGGEGVTDATRELLAAEERLACYRRYATDLPEDGGTPNIAPVAARRKRTPTPAPERPAVTCPNCFVVVPATNTCGVCGWSPQAA